jgi:hypothetical protein
MNKYQEEHNDYPTPELDETIAITLEYFDEDYPGARHFFGDLIEARPWANSGGKGIALYRTDTNEVLYEVDWE